MRTRRPHPSAILALAGAALCAAAGPLLAQDDWVPLDTPAAYADALAGRLVVEDGRDVHFTSYADGTVTGVVEGAAYAATWTIRRGMVCYEGTLEGTGYTYGCAAAFLSGDRLRLDWALQMGTIHYDVGDKGDG